MPRASAFSPTLRIVAWSDTSSIRKKLMYGSETHLTDHLKNSSSPADRCNTPNNQCTRSLPADTTNNRHSHDISSTKSLRVRPQTIPYRSKSGTISGRPCSAPPDHAKNHTAKKHAAKKHAAMYQNKAPPSSGVPLSTLNLALPENVPAAKPANAFQPKLPPKKKFPAWYNPECPNRPAPLSTSPGILIQNPSNPGGTPAAHNFPPDGPDFPTRSHTEPEIRKRPEIKQRSTVTSSNHHVGRGDHHATVVGPKRDLHLSHRIAHLTQQINDCKQLSRPSTIVIK